MNLNKEILNRLKLLIMNTYGQPMDNIQDSPYVLYVSGTTANIDGSAFKNRALFYGDISIVAASTANASVQLFFNKPAYSAGQTYGTSQLLYDASFAAGGLQLKDYIWDRMEYIHTAGNMSVSFNGIILYYH